MGPVRYKLGQKVTITDKSLQNIRNGNRSIHAYPSDSYFAIATDLHSKKLVGEVTQLFPPGYEVNVTFSDGRILQMKDHWVETVGPVPSDEPAPSL